MERTSESLGRHLAALGEAQRRQTILLSGAGYQVALLRKIASDLTRMADVMEGKLNLVMEETCERDPSH